MLLSFLGWLPGGFLLPWQLGLVTGESVEISIWCHFVLSFTLAGLIALPYCTFATEFLVLRTAYPRLWVDPSKLRDRGVWELAGLDRRLFLGQCFAGLVPLVGAVLLIFAGPEHLTAARLWSFRTLLAALIVLGMAGFGLALLVGTYLRQTLHALTRGI
jgi:uncharacterized membrane protein